jgi:hypothetical protein
MPVLYRYVVPVLPTLDLQSSLYRPSSHKIARAHVGAAKINAEHARQRAKQAAREADRAEAYAWSVRMEGYGARAAVADHRQCLNGGLGWLEVECNMCKTRASLPLDAIRRPRDTPIWKLEAALKCRSCRKGPLCAARAHDQADRDAGDHAVSVGCTWTRRGSPIGEGALARWKLKEAAN